MQTEKPDDSGCYSCTLYWSKPYPPFPRLPRKMTFFPLPRYTNIYSSGTFFAFVFTSYVFIFNHFNLNYTFGFFYLSSFLFRVFFFFLSFFLFFHKIISADIQLPTAATRSVFFSTPLNYDHDRWWSWCTAPATSGFVAGSPAPGWWAGGSAWPAVVSSLAPVTRRNSANLSPSDFCWCTYFTKFLAYFKFRASLS